MDGGLTLLIRIRRPFSTYTDFTVEMKANKGQHYTIVDHFVFKNGFRC
jgi:hypothetical protein